MAGKCVGSRWPNPVRGRSGGAGMRCKSTKTGKFIPNRNCNRCPPSLGVRTRKSKSGKTMRYTAPAKYSSYFSGKRKSSKRGRRR